MEDGEQYVVRLEARLADHFGAVGAVCTTSGTAALELAYRAGANAVATLPTFSCVALLNAADATCGLGFSDCNYDPERMDYNASAPWTSVRVHTFGVIDTPKPHVIEDWAMALGATPARINGCCAVLSFHESKIISAQHGGAVVTNDPDLLARLRDLNGYADAVVADRLNDNPTYTMRVNYRMSGLNAALALSQLDRLDEFVNRRGHIAAYYNDRLRDCPAILPTKVPAGSVFGRYVMALERKHPVDAIQAMAGLGVECGRGVWPPLHRYLGLSDASFPNATKACNTVFSLPVWPGLTDGEVEHVAEAARSVLNGN